MSKKNIKKILKKLNALTVSHLYYTPTKTYLWISNVFDNIFIYIQDLGESNPKSNGPIRHLFNPIGHFKGQIFLFPSDSFSPPNIPILSLVEKFGIYFSNFFCLEYELRNVFSEIFSEFTIGKVRDLIYELLFTLVRRQKWKTGGWKKSSGRGMGRENFQIQLGVFGPSTYENWIGLG
jgi:hypothetical protein